MQYAVHSYDVVIVGAGGAGLRAAAEAAVRGARVAVISKVAPSRSHTVAAQGGINAALGNRVEDDWHWHAHDTLKGSDWLADEDSVNFMCEHAPAAIVELEQMGMPFTRDDNGKIYQRAYGGQRADYGKGGLAYRACAVADRTGHSLLHTLYAQALRHGVTIYAECMALDLVMNEEGICSGVLVWRLETGELLYLHAGTTIIATGGFGQAFASTTSSSICTGDGGGMALRAGLGLADMEFIQFHPTSLYGSGVLITEGARGEGAYLLNGKHERFMEQYAPHDMELASRDLISRAMMQEIASGCGAGAQGDHVWLDVRHLPAEVIEHKLPSVRSICNKFARLDPKRELIPVRPAVHFTMGGIPTNAHSEAAPHLLAIGEAACTSVHGANRLGCNALLELIIFGKEAGRKAAENKEKPRAARNLDAALGHFATLRSSNGRQRPVFFKHALQQIMQQHATIFRDGTTLVAGKEKMQQLWQQWQVERHIADHSLLWNNELVEAMEVDNLLRQCLCVMTSATARTESRGAHFRNDFPARDDEAWKKHSLTHMDNSGHITVSSYSVRTAPIAENL